MSSSSDGGACADGESATEICDGGERWWDCCEAVRDAKCCAADGSESSDR